jgi:hypothetical protein
VGTPIWFNGVETVFSPRLVSGLTKSAQFSKRPSLQGMVSARAGGILAFFALFRRENVQFSKRPSL